VFGRVSKEALSLEDKMPDPRGVGSLIENTLNFTFRLRCSLTSYLLINYILIILS
jgi:hypothetical protein